jgi:amidase
LPAISVPGGFTAAGLPVGVQIVGRPRDDFGVLQLAHAIERATGFWEIKPAIVRAQPSEPENCGGDGRA